ncbi:MAG: hypothetical protein CMJ32_06450 [Phycisphaerae bacterium]|nr:hypothetical protein [Phycisphaerae bacterium]
MVRIDISHIIPTLLLVPLVVPAGCIAPGSQVTPESRPPQITRIDAPSNQSDAGQVDSTEMDSIMAQVQADLDLLRSGELVRDPVAVSSTAIQWNQPSSIKPSEPATPREPELAASTAESIITETAEEVPIIVNQELVIPEPTRDLLLARLRDRLLADARGSDMPLAELLSIASLAMTDPGQSLDPESLQDLTEEEAELLRQFHQFFMQVHSLLNESGDASELARAVSELNEQLHPEPVLRIPQALMVSRVGGYGDYDVILPTRFLAHSSASAILYIEMDRFTSTLEDEHWKTSLSVQLEILRRDNGSSVWEQDWQRVIDRSRQKREDFFISQILRWSDHLSVGEYTLKIRVRDEHTSEVVEKGIPFQMHAGQDMPGSSHSAKSQ